MVDRVGTFWRSHLSEDCKELRNYTIDMHKVMWWEPKNGKESVFFSNSLPIVFEKQQSDLWDKSKVTRARIVLKSKKW